jgi:XapX domain-containing protein
MKTYFFSFCIGICVGLIYAALRVKSPAPRFVALVGLLGMLLGEGAFVWLKELIHQGHI